MHVLGEDAPEDHISARIIKYDGNIKEPQWMDVDEGRTRDHVCDTMFASGAHNSKDRFETLCYVSADISEAPYILRPGKLGRMCYYRQFEVVLLVGLTELKAQIRWEDSTTVRIHMRPIGCLH